MEPLVVRVWVEPFKAAQVLLAGRVIPTHRQMRREAVAALVVMLALVV